MKIRRLGLFQRVYLRMIALIAATLLAMLAFSQVHQTRALISVWRQDLQQEAAWIAAHARSDTQPTQLATAWKAMHDGVRLQIVDGAGRVVADSDQGKSASNVIIEVRAPLAAAGPGGELVLTRPGLSLFPNRMAWGLIVTALALTAIAAGVLFPLTRQVTRAFERLSNLAARVAEGQFGATIEIEGDRDLAALISSFNAMSKGLRDAELRNRRLLVDVSHEFRSPLARLRALTDTLARHPDEVHDLSARIYSELELLNRLTDDALSGARFGPTSTDLNLERFEFVEWAAQAFARLRALGGDAAGSIESRITKNAAVIQIDQQRMMQVLGNIVDNARKAISNETSGLIELEAEIDGDWAVFRVSDNGPGFDDADLPFVYERFYQGAANKRGDDVGLGLGLSIARAWLLAHGGQFEIRSAAGHGATVEIRLPVAQRVD